MFEISLCESTSFMTFELKKFTVIIYISQQHRKNRSAHVAMIGALVPTDCQYSSNILQHNTDSNQYKELTTCYYTITL